MYKPRTITNVGHVAHSKPFDDTDTDGCVLGDKILSSLNYGADIGVTASVEFDADVVDDDKTPSDEYEHGVDALCDANLDFFEIGEKFGEMVEAQAPPIPSSTEKSPDINPE